MMELLHEPETWVAVAFLIFLGILAYVGVHKTVLTALDHRAARIKTELEEASRLRDEAAKLLAEYKRKQGEAEREAAAIVSLRASSMLVPQRALPEISRFSSKLWVS